MRSREMQLYLATITGRPVSEVDQRCRPLRANLKIATGRGSSAPHMGVPEAVLHILALASRRPADAFEVAMRLLGDCYLVTHPIYPDLTAQFQKRQLTVGAAILSEMMGSGFQAAGFDFLSFELSEDGHSAWVNFNRRSLKNLRFMFSTVPQFVDREVGGDFDRYQRIDRLAAGSRFLIGAAHLRELGAKVILDAPEEKSDGL